MFLSTVNATTVPNNSHIQKGERRKSVSGRRHIACMLYEMKAYPRNGNDNTIKGFMSSASSKLPWSNWCRARNDPQPGQYNPVSRWNGHGG